MKKDLLLLHGALGSADQFTGLKTLLENDFNIITFNFEGHGGRPANRDYSIALFTENVLQILEEHHLKKIDIFGYSMGGYVALDLALKCPGKVNRIMTLGTKFHWTPEAAAKETRMLNPEKMEEKIPTFTAALREMHQPLDWKEVVTNTAEMMTGLGNGNRLETDDLTYIKHPVLIGLGSEDTMVTLEESERTAAYLPNGRLMEIEGFQHPLEKVDKAVLAEHIRTFFHTD